MSSTGLEGEFLEGVGAEAHGLMHETQRLARRLHVHLRRLTCVTNAIKQGSC